MKYLLIILLAMVVWLSIENSKLAELVKEKQTILDMAGIKYHRFKN